MKSIAKIIKKIGKNFFKLGEDLTDSFVDFWEDNFEDIGDEIKDFVEDWREHAGGKKKSRKSLKAVALYGSIVKVRPAYLFAERVENLLKLIFAISIIISGVIASVWGFTGFSDILDGLIKSYVGRGAIIFFGLCYLIIASWKLLHVSDKH